MVDRIRVIKPPILDDVDPDRNIWGGTNSGYFTISSVFDFIADTNTQDYMEHLSLIWNMEVFERIRNLIWMVHHNRIKTIKYLS